MTRVAKSIAGYACIFNLLACLFFLACTTIGLLYVDLNVRMKYTQLDRAQALTVNEEKLKEMRIPGYSQGAGEMSHRSYLPIYIAQPARDELGLTATWGVVVTVINCLTTGSIWWILRRTPAKPARQEAAMESPYLS